MLELLLFSIKAWGGGLKPASKTNETGDDDNATHFHTQLDKIVVLISAVPQSLCLPATSVSDSPVLKMVAKFFQYKGQCKTRQVQDVMKMRMLLSGACEGACEDSTLNVTCG